MALAPPLLALPDDNTAPVADAKADNIVAAFFAAFFAALKVDNRQFSHANVIASEQK